MKANPKPVVRIEQWFILDNRIIGKVYGHPMGPDGAKIESSNIIKQDLEKKLVETQNTIYMLGDEEPVTLGEE